MTELLSAFIAKRDEIGTKALAASLDISAGAVRMVCTGHYPNPEKVLGKFADRYIDSVVCPFAGRTLQRSDCRQRAHGPKPFGGLSKQQWWEYCQTCPNK